MFEKLHNTAQRTAQAAGHARLFRAAEATAVAYSERLQTGRPGTWLRLRRRIYDRLVYAKLHAALGGRVRYACSGGAPLGVRLGHFLRCAGVTVLEGWGATETTSGVTLNLPAACRIGTVGRPVPGDTVRIGPEEEILVTGPNVFRGYWHDEPATAEAFDPDGWLRTGDLGRLDDGYLTITGRKKDLLITAGGKNVAPALLEDRLRAHWLIDQCLLRSSCATPTSSSSAAPSWPCWRPGGYGPRDCLELRWAGGWVRPQQPQQAWRCSTPPCTGDR